MSLSWPKRKARLRALLESAEDEDEQGLALDRLLHGQSVIGKTSKTTEIDAIRFQDKDLQVLGTLEYGQFGVIDIVNCDLDGRAYIRKSTEKALAIRARDQCSPQFERDILLQALKTDSPWAPHLFCAYQTLSHFNLVMDYFEAGSLWDVLESSPLDGRISENDISWWAPQIVSAMHWCHTQGYVHRDIKPHNFVITTQAHLRLIDFGSAAPLLPPDVDGARLVSKKYCAVLCGTCDYISPEILKAHERALLVLEFEGDSQALPLNDERDVYGLETDWWSMGSMLYEMAYGVAPFFAEDIKRTYVKIMDHANCLSFSSKVSISTSYQDFLRRLLTDAEFRLGRRTVHDIIRHPFFDNVDWDHLTTETAPDSLHLPQFTYSSPPPNVGSAATPRTDVNESQSHAFTFSALFQSSLVSGVQIASPHSLSSSESRSPFTIGFSWGPTVKMQINSTHLPSPSNIWQTPRPLQPRSTPVMSTPILSPADHPNAFVTPMRPNLVTPHGTLPRNSTVRRNFTRPISDREAMKQLENCVEMSARKKVLESGRKPRILNSSSSRSGTTKKELRFVPSPLTVPQGGSNTFSRRGPIIVDRSASSGSEDTDSDVPLSPSPSPRPGSALSMLSRRSGTPTLTGTFSHRTSLATMSSGYSLRQPNLTQAAGPSRRRMSFPDSEPSLVATPLEDATLDKLEEQHISIMDDIRDIEQRLELLLES